VCTLADYMSQTCERQQFTIFEVAADWHELLVLQCHTSHTLTDYWIEINPKTIFGISYDVRRFEDKFTIMLILEKNMNSFNIINMTKCINVNNKTSFVYAIL